MSFARALPLAVAPLLVVAAASAEPPTTGERMVEHARELLGVPYDLGGRLRSARGTDCQGVLFYAAERVSGCGWRSFSVMPTRSIPHGELGRPVPGLAPVATAKLDLARLVKGDVLWFVGPAKNPAEEAIGELDGARVWVWHTGLYAGDGRFVVGDHFAGRVTEEELLPYLRAHADVYSGVLVTRVGDEGIRPVRGCKKHRPMKR